MSTLAFWCPKMIKLYRRTDGRVTAYHEAWIGDEEIVEHWGPLGEKGQTRAHAIDADLDEEQNLLAVLAAAREQGFEPVDHEDIAVLMIEYPVDGMGTEADLEKRHALEGRMDETLGWTGLGHCDGGSIGAGTMEVCCPVVDFEVARRVIEQDLADSDFADFARIYREDDD